MRKSITHISGYRRVWDNDLGKYQWAHRVVWQLHNGDIPEGCVVHHVNGDKSDNRPHNLCVMDAKEHNRMETKSQWDSGVRAEQNKFERTPEVRKKVSESMKIRRLENPELWTT